jgi:hypothetical protein
MKDHDPTSIKPEEEIAQDEETLLKAMEHIRELENIIREHLGPDAIPPRPPGIPDMQ